MQLESIKQDPDAMDQDFFCCYCAKSYDSERMMDKHEVECKLGPRLLVNVTMDKALQEYFCKKLDERKESLRKQQRGHSSKKEALNKSCSEQNTKAKQSLSESYTFPTDAKGNIRKCGKAYSCIYCIYSTSDKSNLNKHVLLHDKRKNNIKDKSFKCTNCTYSTSYKSNLIKHKLIHNKKKVIQCIDCNFSTNYNQNLIRHMLTHNKEKKLLFCANCDYSANQKSSLVRHLLNEHNKRKRWKFSCLICEYKTHHESDFRRHILNRHSKNNKKHVCVKCEKQFKTKKSLDNHIIRDHPDLIDYVSSKVHSCPACAFKTTGKGNLTRHYFDRHSKTDAPRYKCSRCQYVTHRKGTYAHHLKTHLRIKDYNCIICVKGFATKRELQRHIVIKHRDNVHLMSEVTIRIYNCSHCNYTTLQGNHFTSHLTLKHRS